MPERISVDLFGTWTYVTQIVYQRPKGQFVPFLIRNRISTHEISDAKATIAVAPMIKSEMIATARNSGIDLLGHTRLL
ncbi:hypothetical protein HGP17_10405 [Rhizobium sp. P38BS-XIX]|uniref:hypothetical protein n=1 Tax=Rhizobium sp. P38BS-XIX TaxID=2726740 RepID=UPI001457690A|nr:hypothetical protein [Rhizobium sp. P38BS-XIX]NLR97244.1 hypothetical protein [Rhizobium sp. P38BS-XIX]